MQRHKILTGFILTGMALALACGGDDGSAPPPPDPPVVGSVSPDSVAPGDTLIITGSNFSANAAENTVTFWNPLSATKPYLATAKELRVVVDRDAVSAVVTVATPGGSDNSDYLFVERNVGDVFVYGGTGANRELIINAGLNERYLVVPFSANTSASPEKDHAYSIDTDVLNTALLASTKDASASVLHAGPRELFESQRWENARADVARYGRPSGAFDKRPVAAAQVAAPFRQFYVLRTTSGDQNLASSYQRITADLRYNGAKCLVYADVDTLATGNFTQAHFNLFGQTYDNSVEATNVTYFGDYSDVDGNDKVILLISPVVNRLEEPGCTPGDCSCGFIAGFFNPRDLYASPPVPTGTTNHAEVLYLLAADPTGVWDCQFPVDATASENLGTITHEHEHLISFSHRLFYQDQTVQVTWLEEGMAHMAEDLNGDNSSNIGRGKLYRADPGAVSLEDNRATLEQRGGIYLMLRLLADRHGTDILKDIVQSKCSGRACIQNVTGMAFYDAFAEFLAAQYLSGKGITTDDRYNYSSIDLNDFGPLPSPLHVTGGADVTGSVRRSAGDFHIFSLGGIGSSSDNTFRFVDTGGQAVLRNVLVRIQ